MAAVEQDRQSSFLDFGSVRLIYGNTFATALYLALAAPLPVGLWKGRLTVPGPWPDLARVSHRGRLSDWLSDHLGQIANVILPLVTAALVAIAFMHETLMGVPSEAVWTPTAPARFLGGREAGLNLVYAGVAGLLFAAGGFTLKGVEPNRGSGSAPALSWVIWKRMVRWCARAAGLAAVGVVLLVPALLNMLFAVLSVPG